MWQLHTLKVGINSLSGSLPSQHDEIADCTDCPAGKYGDNVGKSICTDCAPGSYSSSGASSCTLCPKGRWSNIQGSSSVLQCKACGKGKWSSEEGLASDDCKLCPTGTWSNTTGLQAAGEDDLQYRGGREAHRERVERLASRHLREHKDGEHEPVADGRGTGDAE